MPAIEEALQAATTALARARIPHAFIGAMGRLAWGRPRSTADLDIQVAVDIDGWSRCVRALEAAGFPLEQEYGEEGPPPDNARFRHADGFRIDVMTAKTSFQAQVVQRAIVCRVAGVDAPVETPEDLVLYKLIAARPKDLDDIEDVLGGRAAAGLPVDWAYIEEHAETWGMTDAVCALRSRFGP